MNFLQNNLTPLKGSRYRITKNRLPCGIEIKNPSPEDTALVSSHRGVITISLHVVGRLEYWNTEMLGIKSERYLFLITGFKTQNPDSRTAHLLSLYIQKLIEFHYTHYSNTPLFQYSSLTKLRWHSQFFLIVPREPSFSRLNKRIP